MWAALEHADIIKLAVLAVAAMIVIILLFLYSIYFLKSEYTPDRKASPVMQVPSPVKAVPRVPGIVVESV